MNDDPSEEDLGDFQIDRSSGKPLSSATGGGGSDFDPSYEEAMAILGRSDRLPPPFAQTAMVMTDGEAADLARRLTALRVAAGAMGGTTLGVGSTTSAPGDTGSAPAELVDGFVAVLQEVPPNVERIRSLAQELATAGEDIRNALDLVREHPGIQGKLEGAAPDGP